MMLCLKHSLCLSLSLSLSPPPPSSTLSRNSFVQFTYLPLYFAEGSLQYEVDLQESELLTYQGPAILELIDGELIVNRKDNHSEIVKWRLSHIRSFKAKKRLLTIFSGR